MSEENKNSELDPGKTEAEESMDSHEYDGIKELNNPAPYWIMLVFIVSIGFAMLYTIQNFGYPGNKKDQVSIYEQSSADFDMKLRQRIAEESGEVLQMSEQEIIATGKKYYDEKGCIACHGTLGEGNAIGPNLADNYWINGCSNEEILDVISNGRAAKGMTPYKTMMTEQQMEHLTSYIKLAIVGSNPANPKDPQGEECK